MKSLITWFVKNPVAANLLMFMMIAGGIFGYNSMQRELFPQAGYNGINVTVAWPGASPRDVEEQLIVRIEEAVDGLDGIDKVESTAGEGAGTVQIATKLNVDFDQLLDEVKARVDTIRNLPPDAFRPEVSRARLFELDIMYLALYGDVDRLALQRLATEKRLELTELPGFQLTNFISKVPEQVTIEISEEALQQYGLTFNQVANAISGASVNLSAGTIQTTGGNVQIRARALANSKEQFDNIIVRQTASGAVVRLGDIANVIDGFETEKFKSSYNRKDAAVFQVIQPEKIDITESGKAIREFKEVLNEELPPDIRFDIWADMSGMFDSRMKLISSNALMGMVLVLIMLTLFLRPMVAFWVTIGIGAAFMGALAVAPFIGVTLNMMSLFAFLLVIGIVVDDAIVVGEAAYFHVENGVEGDDAAIGGASLVVKPVYFAVITTILMFLPILFLSGNNGDFLAPISLVVIAVLTFSLIEAFFILPAHLRHLKHRSSDMNALFRFQKRIADSIVYFAANIFRPFVATLIKYRYITFAIFIGMFIFFVGLLRAGVAPVAMFPNPEMDMISVRIPFPEGTTFKRIDQVRVALEDAVDSINENAKEDFGFDGDLIPSGGTFLDRRSVNAFYSLDSADKRNNIATKEISDKLEEYLGPVPDAYRVIMGFSAGPGGGPGVRYGVASAYPEDLKRAALDLKEGLEAFEKVPRAYDTLESSASEMQFTLKPDAESLGLTLADVTRQVREAIYGREVQRLPRNGEDVRVMVRYPEAARESLDSLSNLRIRTAMGVEVPLFSVADVSFAEGVSRIRRQDRQRVEYVGAIVRGEEQEVADIKEDLEKNFFPEWERNHPRVTRILAGNDLEQQKTNQELMISLLLIFAAMYILLAIAFKSYAQPLLIMIAIPFALVGMIFGNIVTGVPFGLLSLFGFFAASGVAINDNLVLIDYVNRLRAKGVGSYQAMLDACVARFRPILLTSVTTFVGIMPILFESSTQAEFLKPMVVALAFGVLFDFFLTLMLVPALYGIGVDIRRWFIWLRTGVKQPPLGSRYDPNVEIVLGDFGPEKSKIE
ncbi:MAG: efflux RND transporter permease subunit [Hellea sp.]|nr:efflux RND transporter permease subunit [Hellea sp.]